MSETLYGMYGIEIEAPEAPTEGVSFPARVVRQEVPEGIRPSYIRKQGHDNVFVASNITETSEIVSIMAIIAMWGTVAAVVYSLGLEVVKHVGF